jgi:signal-transduction protein with cAMP-binding, CBS, and nucleotidyltransferase domain|tara:strand:- start:121 stop:279 length:159 start_codon:yes stop_codon:yes gene_type:complete
MKEKYTILLKGKVLYKGLTEEEYFDIMEDLSIEYYQKGTPRPQDLKTNITKF